MSERIMIPIPETLYQTRIEVYYDGELNRTGFVSSGQNEASVKLPAPLCECEIRLIPCDAQGKPVGRGHVYEDSSLKPEPTNIAAPSESDEEPGECCEGDCDSSEIIANDAAEIDIERSAPIETHAEGDPEGYDEQTTIELVSDDCDVNLGPNDKVYEYITDDEGQLDSIKDITDEYTVEDEEDD